MKTGILWLAALAATAAAQDNPMSAAVKAQYERTRDVILRSADKVPESEYGFRPTDEVRSFGQILGHLTDEQYLFCSNAIEENPPVPIDAEKTKTSKADLTAALKAAFAYCDHIYAGMTDASGAKMVRFFGGMPKLAVLTFNNTHNAEHYGNLVTYMRLKRIVPPSSERLPKKK